MNRIYRLCKTGMFAAICICAATAAITPAAAHGNDHSQHAAAPELGTSAAADDQDHLWAVTKETLDGQQFVMIQSSSDMGKSWSKPRKVIQTPEPISANGEARPKIAFGQNGEMYISYTTPVARPHVGNIRFVRSLDGGATFSKPITVHHNSDRITHAFESMIVDHTGRIYIAWIDGRDAQAAKANNKTYSGSALYYAVSTDHGATFNGDYKIADHSCECCRIALALNADGNPVAMWRHVFVPNIRDHALVQLTPDGKLADITRVTFDDWRIDACPHQGPSLAYGSNGVRHQVWFNGKEGDGSGVLYAATNAAGKIGTPITIGSAQASHADVAVQGNNVVVAWKQFDGKSTAILAHISHDGGVHWQQKELAHTVVESDQPHLINTRSNILLIWRTQSDGIVTIDVTSIKP